jgi:ABC-type amino acid transport substrate-binding protein
MKKFLTLLLALAMTLSLAACGSDSTEETEEETVDYTAMSDDDLKAAITTVTDGTLTVATSPDFAPYEFYALDENGDPQLAGFDMDLAQYIADYLGLELEVIPMDFDGTIMELQNKNVDLGMAGYSPDPKRADSMDFSDVYITGGQSFVCLESNKDQFTSLEDANNPDYQIGAQVGSIQADLAHENTPDADVIELTKVPDIIAELVTGKLDGAFIETMVAESYATQYPELCLALEVPYDAEGSVVGVSKGNAALLEGVNRAISAAKEDGSFDQYVVNAVDLASGDYAYLQDGEIVQQ